MSENQPLYNATRPSRISLVSGAATVSDRHLEVGQSVDIAEGLENCATVQRSDSLLILGRL